MMHKHPIPVFRWRCIPERRYPLKKDIRKLIQRSLVGKFSEDSRGLLPFPVAIGMQGFMELFYHQRLGS
jgi:hypothetical protein